MQNYLTIDEASELSGLERENFIRDYIETGVVSIKVEDGVKSIELSEFLRVFPNAKSKKVDSIDPEIDLLLKQQKIENLEYQLVQLKRQLEKQDEDYSWLRNKFDSTTLLLEQKLDTSELDKHKQEIKKLSEESIQWEKKYNTLLAANELKTLLKENKELKEKLESLNSKLPTTKINNVANTNSGEKISTQAVVSPNLSHPTQQNKIATGGSTQFSHTEGQFRHPGEQPSTAIKPKRRKIFGIF